MPLFPKPSKPRNLSEISPRLSLESRSPVPGDVEVRPSRPGVILTLTITGACLVMTGGLYALWKQGAFSPESAMANPGMIRQTPAHESITASLDAARKLMKQAEWSRAEAVLRQATAQFPDDQELRVALAETCLGMKKPALAYEQYEKALAIGPREASLEFAAGLVANSAGKTDRAVEHFAQAEIQDPRNASYALNLGMVQRKAGDVDGAKASLLRAGNLDPQNAYAWGTLADIALGENNVNLALQHISRARALQPDSRDWRLIEARTLKRKGDPEKALMLLLPMDVSQRREGPVVRLIADCYGMLQRHADAAAAMADAANADPTNADLARDAAICMERAGDKARAIEFAKRAAHLGDPAAAKIVERLSK